MASEWTDLFNDVKSVGGPSNLKSAYEAEGRKEGAALVGAVLLVGYGVYQGYRSIKALIVARRYARESSTLQPEHNHQAAGAASTSPAERATAADPVATAEVAATPTPEDQPEGNGATSDDTLGN